LHNLVEFREKSMMARCGCKCVKGISLRPCVQVRVRQ